MAIDTINLDHYGQPPLPWERARAALGGFAAAPDKPSYLSTGDPDGRPHTTGIGAFWGDGGIYFTSGLSTRKSRNLAANPFCTIAIPLSGIDLVLEGTAAVVTDPKRLEHIAATARAAGWPAEVTGDALTAPFSAPSAGPPPWHLYFVTLESAVGVATEPPDGATRWRFH